MKNKQELFGTFRTLLGLITGAALLFIAAPAVSQATPQSMLQNATDRMFEALKEERATVKERPERLFELVDEVLVPHVDLDGMSRWVLGRNWRKATPEQQARFIQEFRTLLVRFYVSALLEKPEQLDDLLKARETQELITFIPGNVKPDAKKTLVRAEVQVPNGPTVPVSFRLYRRGNADWKVIDVTVDGISLVTNYRTSFASEIEQGGVEGLLERLALRNEELLAETRNKGASNGAKKADGEQDQDAAKAE